MLGIARHDRIEPTLSHQLFMGALLHQLPGLDDQNPIRLPDGAEAMGDGNQGPRPLQRGQGRGHRCLGAAVQGAGRFIQENDRWITQ